MTATTFEHKYRNVIFVFAEGLASPPIRQVVLSG
jgi:hypothetical protein